MGDTITTPFLKWKDEYAWTENLSVFRREAKRETALFKGAIRGRCAAPLANEFAKAQEEHLAALTWSWGPILYRPNLQGGGGYEWKFEKTGAWKEAGSLDCVEELCVYTRESDTGTEAYQIVARSKGRVLWKSSERVAAEIAILGSKVFALQVESPLRYNTLISMDLHTGKSHKVVFTNTDDRWLLRLVRGSRGGLFLIQEQAGYQKCFQVLQDGTCERIAPKAVCVEPLGYTAEGKLLALVRLRGFNSPWEIWCQGSAAVPWTFPPEAAHHGLEFVTADGILITLEFGKRILWRDGRPVKQFVGQVLPDPLALWRGDSPPSCVWLVIPGRTLECMSLGGATLVKGESYGVSRIGEAISSDGLPVRWVLVQGSMWTQRQPRGLLVVAYGGYGSPTPLGTARWKPWLDAGWAVAFALVRGGGDGNDVWASLGRMAGKEQGIDDLEAVLVVLQERLKVSPNNTCVYGRSAGGLLIGGIAARHPMGGLAGKVYAEVPYVDLLKTAGNPALPLTPSEYTEFGNPMRGPAEFQEALRTSPVHRLSPIGAPGLRVVCRVGLFDRQVYPYESLKWILALRGGRPAPDDKWLVVDMAGHFEHGSSHFHAMAEDFCLIQG